MKFYLQTFLDCKVTLKSALSLTKLASQELLPGAECLYYDDTYVDTKQSTLYKTIVILYLREVFGLTKI